MTLERSVSGVLSEVTSQLIRSGELPAAAFPVAVVGLFTCVRPHVCFKVRALSVGFPTARELAVVRGGALSGPRPTASLLFGAPHLFMGVKV